MARSKQKRQRSRGKADNNTKKRSNEEDRAGGDPEGEEEDRLEDDEDAQDGQRNADDEVLEASKDEGDEADTTGSYASLPQAFGKGGGATVAEGAEEEQDEQLSTFDNREGKVVVVADDGQSMEVLLEAGESLCLVGSAQLTVLQGALEVNGYTARGPSPEPLVLHSPRFLGALTLKHTIPPSPPSPSPSPAPSPSPSPAACRLRLCPCSSSCPLPRFLTACDDAVAIEGGTTGFGLSGFRLVLTQSRREGRPIRPLYIPPSWTTAIDRILDPPPRKPPSSTEEEEGAQKEKEEEKEEEEEEEAAACVVVCGAKGVGKSTLARYLVNRYLGRSPLNTEGSALGVSPLNTEGSALGVSPVPAIEEGKSGVLFLDCDVGQPELSPPGLVSLTLVRKPLLGPPHTHLCAPDSVDVIRRYWVGDAQSKGDPPYYLACLSALVGLWRGDKGLRKRPLVVNMDGWVKGFGETLLAGAMEAVQPDVVLKLQGTHKSTQFSVRYNMTSRSTTVNLEVGTGYAPRTATPLELRTLRLLAYFLQGVAPASLSHVSQRCGAVLDPGCHVAWALASLVPDRVPWRCVHFRVMHEAVAPWELPACLNAAFVGLLAGEVPAMEVVEGEGAMAGLRMLRRNLPLACLGLGIVRAVDVAEARLLVLTPVPLELLRHCTVLARGALQIPMVMMDLRSGGPNPYLSNEAVSGEGAAQLTQGRLNIARRRGGPAPAGGGGGD